MAKIEQDVLDVLRDVDCDGNELRILANLPRPLYTKTDKVLRALGGKWDRKSKSHVFEEEAWPLIADAVSAGEYVDAKKEFQFFETPPDIVELMLDYCNASGASVLEPSAGRGAIALAAREAGAKVGCIEIQQKLVDVLESHGLAVARADFLTTEPTPAFDVVLMNPPFTRSQDIDHILHAYEWLKPGGTLVAIASAGWTFRTDRKAKHFQEWMTGTHATYEDLEPGAFRSSGTMVRTTLIRVFK